MSYCNIEVIPDDCIFSYTTSQGEIQWFVRIAISGLYPRRYGPFASEEKAQGFLDLAAGELFDALTEAGNSEFIDAKASWRVVTEDELVSSPKELRRT